MFIIDFYKMFSRLRLFLNSKANISDEEFEKIQPLVFSKTVKKGDFIIRQSEYCHFIGFINSGLIRSWYINNLDKEITTQFIFEGCFFTYLEGLLDAIPSHKNMQALEDCDVLMIKKDKLPLILQTSPKFEIIFRLILLDDSLLNMQTSEDKQNETPQERYLKFLKQNPTANNRISIKYIASYLGIEPQSLSRIRKRITLQTKVT